MPVQKFFLKARQEFSPAEFSLLQLLERFQLFRSYLFTDYLQEKDTNLIYSLLAIEYVENSLWLNSDRYQTILIKKYHFTD